MVLNHLLDSDFIRALLLVVYGWALVIAALLVIKFLIIPIKPGRSLLIMYIVGIAKVVVSTAILLAMLYVWYLLSKRIYFKRIIPA
ncbi:MAG: hypothetical protein DRN96_01945 [Thermoproteota archaeon]|nr:MAG: hypothetical protein DRN96_01945 [Candidatus Korarchaeota archaeon]RLG54345.1 MAG: hypothetical protein DRN99_05270 [Candidatus Korarchaeota archaeon]